MENVHEQIADTGPRTPLLLHACCGFCSLEPARMLADEGYSITIYYTNSNIWPRAEYDKRLHALCAWAALDDIRVVEGSYDNDAWACAVDEPTRLWQQGVAPREERCRLCYRLRLEEAARYAADQGFPVLSTTLSLSIYQHTTIVAEELARASALYGVEAHFEDFRARYEAALIRSRAIGMYCQNYCGCALSISEAEETRARIKAQRAAEKAAWREAHADELAREEAERREAREARVAERKAYDDRQARKRAILRDLRAQQKAQVATQPAPGAEHGEEGQAGIL